VSREAVILLSASKQRREERFIQTPQPRRNKVDTDAIALKVKHEFAAKEKARSAAKSRPKSGKALKKIALRTTILE